MLDCFDQFDDYEYMSFNTKYELANNIKLLYLKNKCWTWYSDWKWFKEESFIRDASINSRTNKSGKTIPLNFIYVELFKPAEAKSNIMKRVIKKIFRKAGFEIVSRRVIQKND